MMIISFSIPAQQTGLANKKAGKAKFHVFPAQNIF